MAGLTSPASATASVFCTGAGGVSIEIGIGNVPVAAVISTVIVAGDSEFSIAGGEIAVGQDFIDSERFDIDYTDPNVSGVIAQIRIVRASEGEDFVMAGTLRIKGVGAYAIICDGI